MYSAMEQRGYNFMEVNKENYNFSASKFNSEGPYQTPQKSGRGFISYSEAFATPAHGLTPFGQRNCSIQDTPVGRTNYKSQPSEFGQGPGVSVEQYEDLKAFRQEVTLKDIQTKIRQTFSQGKQGRWEEKFEAVTILRSLNKTYPQDIFEIFNEFGHEILQCFHSDIILIQKNILLFSYEIVEKSQGKRVDERIISLLVPQLINRSLSSIKEIRKAAREILEKTLSLYPCESTIQAIMRVIKEKRRGQLKCFAIKTLSFVLSQIGDAMLQLKNDTIADIILSYNVCLREGVEPEICRKAQVYFKNLMSFDLYTKFLKEMLDHNLLNRDDAEELVKCVQTQTDKQQSKAEANLKNELIKKEIKNMIVMPKINRQPYVAECRTDTKTRERIERDLPHFPTQNIQQSRSNHFFKG